MELQLLAHIHHSHSNTASEPHLGHNWDTASEPHLSHNWDTASEPHLVATLDPYPTEQGQGSKLRPRGHYVQVLNLLRHNRHSLEVLMREQSTGRAHCSSCYSTCLLRDEAPHLCPWFRPGCVCAPVGREERPPQGKGRAGLGSVGGSVPVLSPSWWPAFAALTTCSSSWS